MTWEVHARTQFRNPVPGVKVSGCQRMLRFNALAADMLIDVQALRLLHDGDRIAFEPVSFSNPDGFALAHIGSNAWVQCYGFIKNLGLRRHQSWSVQWDQDLALGELPVGEPCEESPVPRPPRRGVEARLDDFVLQIGGTP